MCLVLPGDGLRPELAERLDVVLHSEGSWAPAPPRPPAHVAGVAPAGPA